MNTERQQSTQTEVFKKRVGERAYFARLNQEPSHDLDVAAYLDAEKVEKRLGQEAIKLINLLGNPTDGTGEKSGWKGQRTPFDWETPEGRKRIEEEIARKKLQEHTEQAEAEKTEKDIEPSTTGTRLRTSLEIVSERPAKEEKKEKQKESPTGIAIDRLHVNGRDVKSELKETIRKSFNLKHESEDVRRATEVLEKINRERKEPAIQSPKPEPTPVNTASKPKEVEKPADTIKEVKSGLTQEAMDFLKIWEFATANIGRIAKENGVSQEDINGKKTAELIAMLAAKAIPTNTEKGREAGAPTPKVENATKPKSTEIKTGLAVWNDQPVKITGYAGQLDGKDFVHIEGTNAIIPLDEIRYPKEDAKPEAAKAAETPQPKAEEASKPDETDKAEEEKRIGEIVERKVAEKVKAIEEAAAKRIKAIEAEAHRMIAEQRAIAIKEGRKEGVIEGKREGKKELWTKLKEKTKFSYKIKNLFKRHPKEPKTDQEKVDKYKRDIFRTLVFAGVGGAIAALTGVAIAQYFGVLLPIPISHLPLGWNPKGGFIPNK